MQESHSQGPANQTDPESCVRLREEPDEALTGAHADAVSSCENTGSRAPTSLTEAEGKIGASDNGERVPSPAQSETRRTRGNSSHGSREIPAATRGVGTRVRSAKGTSPKADMHAAGKSDRSVVPMKRPNKPGAAAAKATGSGGAEDVEGRGLAKENATGRSGVEITWLNAGASDDLTGIGVVTGVAAGVVGALAGLFTGGSAWAAGLGLGLGAAGGAAGSLIPSFEWEFAWQFRVECVYCCSGGASGQGCWTPATASDSGPRKVRWEDPVWWDAVFAKPNQCGPVCEWPAGWGSPKSRVAP